MPQRKLPDGRNIKALTQAHPMQTNGFCEVLCRIKNHRPCLTMEAGPVLHALSSDLKLPTQCKNMIVFKELGRDKAIVKGHIDAQDRPQIQRSAEGRPVVKWAF